ncbi:MAG: tRNA (guanosine(37)-N1)-methyltransferase TrmD [Nitrospirae bacterium GWC2_42_7]|nr:MAG: tRNA (guanosine(37)-N1)-methyltransferase TrmD [Nitrospirae bacterium GWC2_42_7]
MKFSVVTIFPDMVNAYLGASIMKRAIQSNIITVDVHNLRDYSIDKHRSVDDYSYGGGAGMVMRPEPFFKITETLWPDKSERRIIMMSPKGRLFKQDIAEELTKEKRDIVFLCGRYEAIDERVMENLVDDEFSIGDYVLTGGELPALVIIDAVARLIPGVLGDSHSIDEESFSWGLLDYPHYTRPENFREMKVPEVLLSGNHKEINRWRKKQALKATLEKRPELIDKYILSDIDKEILKEIQEEAE